MKASLLATLAATALLSATSAFAAPFNDRGRHDDQRFEQGPGRHADHFDRSRNYGFERNHRATRDERYRWERAHNYGYAQGHRVLPQEQARWEAGYRR